MNKKGQITIFVILGIVILAIIGLLYYAVHTQTIPNPFTSASTISVSDQVGHCLDTLGTEALDLLGKQGGELTPTLYQNWCVNTKECYQVNYLCYTDQLEPCVNREPFIEQHMEQEMQLYMDQHLSDCVNPNLWKESGYTVSAGEHHSKVSIGREDVLVIVDWPLTIQKGNFVETQERFSQTFHVPLGLLSETAHDIVNSEITAGDFWVVPYVTSKHGNVEIEKHLAKNSKIYIVNAFQDNYKFYFAVQGWAV